MSSKKNNYYAYRLPSGKAGVVSDWKKCEALVSGVQGARYRGFVSEKDARAWLAEGAHYEEKIHHKLEPGIYFDAGTGRGEGVEVSVTDESGKNLLHKAIAKSKLNTFGKYNVAHHHGEATNNYGELLGLRYALEIAKKENIKKVFGDSRLVIDHWSRWHIKRKELPEATVRLADEVAQLRESFERQGGAICRISGDDNPADLGFHR